MATPESVRQAFDLSGRVAIVTGAGSGIGRADAEAFAGAGAVVVCADLQEEEDRAQETAERIGDHGGEATGRPVDVSTAEAVTSLVAGVVGIRGRLDVMCNIAGTMIDGEILAVEDDDLDRIVAVNLKGVLHGAQAAGRAMVEARSGSIVNMSSAAALVPSPGIGAYAITKAAVLQLTRSMAVEVGHRGVRVNAVAPGFVPTEMTARCSAPARRDRGRGTARAGGRPDAPVRPAAPGGHPHRHRLLRPLPRL